MLIGHSLDPVLRALGGRSRYQLLQLLAINIGVWGSAFQLLDNIFIGRKIEWKQCAFPDNSSISSMTAAQHWDLPHVDWHSEHVTYGECEITVSTDHGNDTYPCLFGYKYDYARHLSFRTEFDLVCGRSLLADFLQTLVIMGQGCGAFLASFLSDRFGRKRVLVWSQLGLLVVGMAIALTPSFTMLATLKFAVGCLQQGVMTGKATMSIELFPSEFRSMTSLMMAMMWMSGTCSMALISFFMQDYSWRWLQAVLSAVSLLGFVQMWYVDESLRWLLANGKKDRAIRVLQRAAKINRQDVRVVMRALCGQSMTHEDTDHDTDTELSATHHDDEEEPKKKAKRTRKRSKALEDDWDMLLLTGDDTEDPFLETGGISKENATARHQSARDIVAEQKPIQKLTLLDVLKHRRLRFYTMLVWATWFTCTFSSFSLYVMSTSLHGNRFLNFFLTASMKLPAGLLFFYMVDRAGRKAGIQLFFILASFGLLTSAVFRAHEDSSTFAILSVPASLIGAIGATGIFGAMFLYTPELYPTNIRQQALGFASLAGRFGGMIAPFMIPLSEIVVWAPGAITGSMCLVIIFLFRFLPETKGRELPHILQDVDKWDSAQQQDVHDSGGILRFCQSLNFPKYARFVQKMLHSVFALVVRFCPVKLARRFDTASVLTV